MCIPRPLSPTLTGVKQFAQLTLNQRIGAANNLGPAVFLLPNGENCYWCNWSGAAVTIQLMRGINALTALAAAVPVVVPGDVIRIEVVPSPASNLVTMLINGVIVSGPIVDAAGARPVLGMPGIAYWGNSANGGSGVNFFSCGRL